MQKKNRIFDGHKATALQLIFLHCDLDVRIVNFN